MINDLLKIGQQIKDLPGTAGLTIRDFIVDAVLPGAKDYHKKMFIKALTGGTKGTVTEIPEEIASDIIASHVTEQYPYRSKSDPQNPILSTYGTTNHYQIKGDDGKPIIHKPGMRTAGSLGHVQLQIDPKGTGKAIMTDKWKVDPDPNYVPWRSRVHADLKEGGTLAARSYDMSKALGLYKDIDFRVGIQHPQLQPIPYKEKAWRSLEE